MLAALQESGIEVLDVRQVRGRASDWSRRLLSETEGATALAELIEKVELATGSIRVRFRLPLLSSTDETAGNFLTISRVAPMRLRRRGVEQRIIHDGDDELPPRKADPALLKAVARARRWFVEIGSGRAPSSAEIARREGLQKGYLARLMRLAFLSPAIVEAVAEGRALTALNLQTLMTKPLTISSSWCDHERLLTTATS